MKKIARMLFRGTTLWTCLILSLTTGCASGGFKLTRQYARFVNSQQIIIRCVLYILTAVVFAATMLIDMVIFNTMDFWEGRVSQGTYDFKDGEKSYHARHEILPGSNLKRSTIQVSDSSGKQLQEVVLTETPSGEIEYSINGKLRARIRDIKSVPVATFFDHKGILVEERFVLLDSSVAAK